MGKRHKWADVIVAWSEGAEIEQIYTYANLKFDNWEQVNYPCWYEDDAQFRIKLQPKEPQYLYVYMNMQIDKHNYVFRTSKHADGTYIGKIKLEVDDD
jgi:hypothetical protein